MIAETWPMRVAAVLRIVEHAAATRPFVEQNARAAEADHAKRLAAFPRSEEVPFVVTGASGSLGSAVVKRLVGDGKNVRVFVRRIPRHPVPGVEYASATSAIRTPSTTPSQAPRSSFTPAPR